MFPVSNSTRRISRKEDEKDIKEDFNDLVVLDVLHLDYELFIMLIKNIESGKISLKIISTEKNKLNHFVTLENCCYAYCRNYMAAFGCYKVLLLHCAPNCIVDKFICFDLKSQTSTLQQLSFCDVNELAIITSTPHRVYRRLLVYFYTKSNTLFRCDTNTKFYSKYFPNLPDTADFMAIGNDDDDTVAFSGLFLKGVYLFSLKENIVVKCLDCKCYSGILFTPTCFLVCTSNSLEIFSRFKFANFSNPNRSKIRKIRNISNQLSIQDGSFTYAVITNCQNSFYDFKHLDLTAHEDNIYKKKEIGQIAGNCIDVVCCLEKDYIIAIVERNNTYYLIKIFNGGKKIEINMSNLQFIFQMEERCLAILMDESLFLMGYLPGTGKRNFICVSNDLKFVREPEFLLEIKRNLPQLDEILLMCSSKLCLFFYVTGNSILRYNQETRHCDKKQLNSLVRFIETKVCYMCANKTSDLIAISYETNEVKVFSFEAEEVLLSIANEELPKRICTTTRICFANVDEIAVQFYDVLQCFDIYTRDLIGKERFIGKITELSESTFLAYRNDTENTMLEVFKRKLFTTDFSLNFFFDIKPVVRIFGQLEKGPLYNISFNYEENISYDYNENQLIILSKYKKSLQLTTYRRNGDLQHQTECFDGIHVPADLNFHNYGELIIYLFKAFCIADFYKIRSRISTPIEIICSNFTQDYLYYVEEKGKIVHKFNHISDTHDKFAFELSDDVTFMAANDNDQHEYVLLGSLHGFSIFDFSHNMNIVSQIKIENGHIDMHSSATFLNSLFVAVLFMYSINIFNVLRKICCCKLDVNIYNISYITRFTTSSLYATNLYENNVLKIDFSIFQDSQMLYDKENISNHEITVLYEDISVLKDVIYDASQQCTFTLLQPRKIFLLKILSDGTIREFIINHGNITNNQPLHLLPSGNLLVYLETNNSKELIEVFNDFSGFTKKEISYCDLNDVSLISTSPCKKYIYLYSEINSAIYKHNITENSQQTSSIESKHGADYMAVSSNLDDIAFSIEGNIDIFSFKNQSFKGRINFTNAAFGICFLEESLAIVASNGFFHKINTETNEIMQSIEMDIDYFCFYSIATHSKRSVITTASEDDVWKLLKVEFN